MTNPHDLRDIIAAAIAARGHGAITAVANQTGIPRPNISAWLAGRRAMLLERQIAIAEALGYRYNWSLTPPPQRKRRPGAAQGPRLVTAAGQS